MTTPHKPTTLTAGQRLHRRSRASTAQEKRDARRIDNLIILGASAGGHRALTLILKDLPPDLPAAIVILMHLPLDSVTFLKNSIGRYSRLPIVEVLDRQPLQQGFIFIPPPGHALTFDDGNIVVSDDAPPRPVTTINRTFSSAAKNYGPRVIGVVLTGLLKDGTDGLRAVHDAGGLTMVQDPREAEFPSMPTNAMQNLPVTFCLNLAEIGPALELLARRAARFETGLAVAVRTLRHRAALLLRLEEQSTRNPATRTFLKHELVLLRRDLHSLNHLVEAKKKRQRS